MNIPDRKELEQGLTHAQMDAYNRVIKLIENKFEYATQLPITVFIGWQPPPAVVRKVREELVAKGYQLTCSWQTTNSPKPGEGSVEEAVFIIS